MMIFILLHFIIACYSTETCWNGGEDPTSGDYCHCSNWFRNTNPAPGKCDTKSCGYNGDLDEKNDCECDFEWEGPNCEFCKTDTACRYFLQNQTGLEDDFQVVCRQNYIYSYQRMNFNCEVRDEFIADQLGDFATFQCDGVGYADSFSDDMKKACYLQAWGRYSYYHESDNGTVTEDYYGQTLWCDIFECEATLTTDETIIYRCQDTKCYSTYEYADDTAQWGSDYQRISIADKLTGFSQVECDSDGMCTFQTEAFPNTFLMHCNGSECLDYDYPILFPEPPDYVLFTALPALLVIFFICCCCVIYFDCCLIGLTQFERHSLKNYAIAGGEIEFENIHYYINVFKDRGCLKARREILCGISFKIEPGNLCSVMGATGAGKTTLLDILAQRNKTGKITGSILFNSRNPGSTFRRLTGYVVQDDYLMGTMTVRECIMFSADLRLPVTFCDNRKRKICDEVMKMLGIYEIRNTRIGDEIVRGISGGERKRVSVALEMVVNPHLLFLDEPTSGLDASTAHELVNVLKRLTVEQGRTIVMSIHQPRAKIFRLFDTLILLSAGHMVYGGRASGVVSEFERRYQIKFPGGTENPADWVLDIVCQEEKLIQEEKRRIEENQDLLMGNPLVFNPDRKRIMRKGRKKMKRIEDMVRKIGRTRKNLGREYAIDEVAKENEEEEQIQDLELQNSEFEEYSNNNNNKKKEEEEEEGGEEVVEEEEEGSSEVEEESIRSGLRRKIGARVFRNCSIYYDHPMLDEEEPEETYFGERLMKFGTKRKGRKKRKSEEEYDDQDDDDNDNNNQVEDDNIHFVSNVSTNEGVIKLFENGMEVSYYQPVYSSSSASNSSGEDSEDSKEREMEYVSTRILYRHITDLFRTSILTFDNDNNNDSDDKSDQEDEEERHFFAIQREWSNTFIVQFSTLEDEKAFEKRYRNLELRKLHVIEDEASKKRKLMKEDKKKTKKKKKKIPKSKISSLITRLLSSISNGEEEGEHENQEEHDEEENLDYDEDDDSIVIDKSALLVYRRSFPSLLTYATPFSHQVWVLCWRSTKNFLRNYFLIPLHFFSAIVLGIVMGLIYFQSELNFSGAQNRLGVMFFMCAIMSFTAMSGLEIFIKERPIFMRERANGYYYPFVYYSVKVMFDLIPLRVIPPIFMGSICYFMIGLNPDFGRFVVFLLMIILFNILSGSMIIFIGTISNSVALANITATMLILMNSVFSGFLINRNAMPGWIEWLRFLSYWNYVYENLVINELNGRTIVISDEVGLNMSITIPGSTILEIFGMSKDNFGTNILISIIFAVGMILASGFWVQFFVKERK